MSTRAKRAAPRKLGRVTKVISDGSSCWLIEYWSSDVWTVTVRNADLSWSWLVSECSKCMLLRGHPQQLSCFRSLEEAERALALHLLKQGG